MDGALDFFIVLGEVPGTGYFLSFADVLWIALLLLLVPLWRWHRSALAYEVSQFRFRYFSILLTVEKLAIKLGLTRKPGETRRMSATPITNFSDLH